MDLRTGRTLRMDPLPIRKGHEFRAQAAVGLDDAVLLGGVSCRLPPPEPTAGADRPCDADAYLFYLLDPAGGRWRETEVPATVDRLGPSSIAMLQARSGGGAVADLWVDGNGSSVIIALEGNRWRQVGQPRPSASGEGCATATELVHLASFPMPATGDVPGSGTVGYQASVRSLATGEVRALPPPPIQAGFGGNLVQLSCGATGVALVAPGRTPTDEATFLTLAGGRWSEIPITFDPRVVPLRTWSGGPVPVVGVGALQPSATSPTKPAPPTPVILVRAGPRGGELATGPNELRDRRLVQVGTTGRFLVLGPLQAATEFDEFPDSDKPIPIEQLTVD